MMDYILSLLLVSFVWTSFNVLTFSLSYLKSSSAKLPPGPRPFPIIGNLLELGNKPHQSLANLSKTYGPLIRLKLGSITTIVISSPDIAKQILQTKDHNFSNRTIPDAARALDHHKLSVGWLPVAAHWRHLRKICSVQMFTTQRLDASQALRLEKVHQLLDHVQENCNCGRAVDIGQAAFTTSLNLLSNTLFSIDLAHFNVKLSHEFKGIVSSVMELYGKPNLADYFPALRLLDLQGIRRQMATHFKKILKIFNDIIDQRLRSRTSSVISPRNDVLDALLDLTKEIDPEFSYNDINHLLLDLFLAGTDTTSSTLEWAMAELLHNPETIAKAKIELQEVIGKGMPVQESDISRLPYLQAVIKETLRLHPPAPFLVPYKAEFDSEINGFKVPKDAQVLVNIWAIGRDPSIWSNPNTFVPERFLKSKIDLKGQNFELIPFGAGRRICPGMPLAYRMEHLMLASLLHSFDWKLENGMKPEHMDMSSQFGLTLHKSKPLLAIPFKV